MNELGIIQDGALLVRNGVILQAGPSRRLENLAEARDAQEVNAAGRVVMPGFVDSHTHLLYPLPGDNARPGDAERALHAMSGQRMAARARSWLQAMARHGTTTVEAKTGAWCAEGGELKLLRALRALESDPVDVVPTFLLRAPAAPEAEVRELARWVNRELLPTIAKRKLARFADIAWEDSAERMSCFESYLETARSLGLRGKVHAENRNLAPAITAAVSEFALSVDHMDHLAASEVPLLAGSCTIATLLPCFSCETGARYAPARELIDGGAAVAIATNFNPAETPSPSMQTAIAMACMFMKMSPAEAITSATINGACALGRGDRTGSLEPGKLADAVILNASDYRELGRHVGVNLVNRTMKRGEFIYTEGEVARRDSEMMRAQMALRC
jgi:imidazolonepropionase